MVGDYELWSWNYPIYRLKRRSSVLPIRGIGEDAPAPAQPIPENPAAPSLDQRRLHDVGKGIFVGTAYGIAVGMIISGFVMRKDNPAAQLKQNNRLVLLGSLFGATVGGLGAVQAEAMQT